MYRPGLLLFAVAFSVGMGPVTWLLAAEVFPLEVRAKGMALACGCNRVSSALIAVSFLKFTRLVGDSGVWFLFALVSFAAWVFFYGWVPETKGKTLEEMPRLFEALATRSRRSSGDLLNATRLPSTPSTPSDRGTATSSLGEIQVDTDIDVAADQH